MTGSGQLGSVVVEMCLGGGKSASSAAAWLETKWSVPGIPWFGIRLPGNGLRSLSVSVPPMTPLYSDKSQLPLAGGPRQEDRTRSVGTLSNTFAPWDVRVP